MFGPFSPSDSDSPLANGLTSPSTLQPPLRQQELLPVCTWSAHPPQSGPSQSPFPRSSHTLTTTATASGELLLFGGDNRLGAKNDLHVFSTHDFSTRLLQTSGKAPTPRRAHGAALIGTTLLICGGKTNSGNQNVLGQDDSLYLLNLESREWTRVVANGPGPGGRYYHTVSVIGSELFVFGGLINGKSLNDMWALDLNSLKSQPFWELYEPAPGNEKPLPRTGHVSVTTKDRIIVFGGCGNQHYYNDTWSFDISTRKWTELQCTGSIPSPRASHTAVLVDDVMYVFGGCDGFFMGEGYLDDLYSLQLSTQRWFKFHNVGHSPLRRSDHAMASDGTRVFVLGGGSLDPPTDEVSLVHVFYTKDIKYPYPERNAVNPNEKTYRLVQKSFTGPPTPDQPQHLKFSSSEAHGASRLQNPTPAVSDRPASLQITHKRKPGPNGRPLGLTLVTSKPRRVLEGGVREGSMEYHAKFATPHSSEGIVTGLECERYLERIAQPERQLSVSLTAQTEGDQRIARLTGELELMSTLLEEVKWNAAEEKRLARFERREHEDRPLAQTSLVKQRDVELVDMQSKLKKTEAKLEEVLLSFGQQIGRYGAELADLRAELEAKKSESEAFRLRLTYAEDGWARSKAKADKLHIATAASLVDLNEDRDMYEPKEDMQSLMECRNEG